MASGATQTATLNEQVIYGASRIGEVSVNKLIYSTATGTPAFTDVNANKLGNKKYELTNHLGNVLAVITDRNLVTSGGTPSIYEAVVIMKSDYYPFGMEMPGRNSNTSAYRFGYNGMEQDPEAKGQGNSYTTEFRQYDPRLGRWMSLDPMMMSFADESPYCAFADNPVYYTDPYGLDPGNGDKDKDGKSKGLAEGISGQVSSAKKDIEEWDPEKVEEGIIRLEPVNVKPRTGGTIGSIVASQREGIRSFADANEKAGNKGLATAIRVIGGIDIAIISKFEVLDVANPKAYSNNYHNLPGDAVKIAIVSNELKINPFTANVALGLAGKAQVLQKGNAQDITEVVASMLIDIALSYEAGAIASREVVFLPNSTKGAMRSLDDLSSLKGATWKEAESLIPKDWIRGTMKKGEGLKFVNPAKKGEQILLEQGWQGAKDPLHAGPYMKISRNGHVTRIPLAGNPILE